MYYNARLNNFKINTYTDGLALRTDGLLWDLQREDVVFKGADTFALTPNFVTPKPSIAPLSAEGPLFAVINGTEGDDTLTGTADDDTINGLGGDDTIDGGYGNDILEGGSGNDILNGGAEIDDLFGGDGNDTLNGDEGFDNLRGGNGDDTLNGGAGNDRLDGGAGNNILNGGDGNDDLRGGAGINTLNGGAGQDAAEYTFSSAGVTVDLSDATNNTGDAANDIFESIEHLGGSRFDDTLIGDTGDNQLFGNEGDDTLRGKAGNDSLRGGNGNDTLIGGVGDDILDGGNDDDNLTGGQGSDEIRAGWGDDIIYAGGGDDVIDGDRGTDILVLSGASIDEYEITDTDSFGRFTITHLNGGVDGFDQVEDVEFVRVNGVDYRTSGVVERLTEDADVYTGTRFADTIRSLGGDDIICKSSDFI